MVIWIIGKSGVGKSYFAKKIFDKLKLKIKKIIWVDGDKFRLKYSNDLGYSIKDRRLNSSRLQKHCLNYDKKKYLVICSVLSIFPDHQKYNKKIFNKYLQIHITVDQKILNERNNKKIYSEKKNVVGKDIKFPKPYRSNLVIKNCYDKKFLENLKTVNRMILNEL